jgi:DNA-binding CsgD family transcriptional regulator
LAGPERRVSGIIPALALEWMARETRARLLVTDMLDLLWANAAAQAVLGARHDLEVRDGALAATNSAHQDDLAAFVRRSGPDVETLVIPSEDRNGHVLIRAQRVGREPSDRFVGIHFHRSHVHISEYADFRKIFGLTQAEHQVLLYMLDGKTADEVSCEKQVSIDTVRYQIRQIYEKLGVSSRESLFRRIRPYIL